MNKIIDTYGGYEISYNEEESKFEGYNKKEDNKISAESLKLIKGRIDKLDAEPKVVQPQQDALRLEQGYYGSNPWLFTMQEIFVGAFGYKKPWASSSREDLFAWITGKSKGRYGKKRERVEMPKYSSDREKIFEDTPEARKTIAEIIAIGEKVDAFVAEAKEEQESLLASLVKVSPKVEDEKLPHWNQ